MRKAIPQIQGSKGTPRLRCKIQHDKELCALKKVFMTHETTKESVSNTMQKPKTVVKS